MPTKLNPHKQLFETYCNLQSNEMKDQIQGYRKLNMKNVNLSIKVLFKDGNWLHVYQKYSGVVEWY